MRTHHMPLKTTLGTMEGDEDEDLYFSQEKDILSQDPSQTDINACSSSDDDEELGGRLAAHAYERRPGETSSGQSERQSTADRKPQTYAHLVVFTAHKAGMDYKAGLDQDKINKIIHENSVGSRFYNQALAQNKKTEKRIEHMKKKLQRLPPIDYMQHRRIISKFEKDERKLDRWWCVVDFDMFYAAVAMRDDPSLIGKPVAVGGMSMISTANYEARKYGVRSAMPGFIARKLCPHLKFVKCNWANVKEAAAVSRKIFAQIDPNYTTMSLDEASLDITDYMKSLIVSQNSKMNDGTVITYKNAPPGYLQRQAEDIVRKMRSDISKATNGLTISAGIASNRMLAKIASDFNKPNGQYTIEADAQKIIDFMGKLSIRKIPFVGKVTEHIIKEVLGCEKVHELLEPEKMLRLYQLFTADVANFLVKSALGISRHKHDDSIKVGPSQKGISNERTFKELSATNDLHGMVDSLAASLSEQMKAKNLKGKTITLKLKTSNFEVKTRATTIVSYTNEAETISKHVKKLLSKEMPIRLRLMGIRVANFRGKSEPVEKNQKQLSTFFKRSDEGPSAAQNGKFLGPRKTTVVDPVKPLVTVDGTVDENFVTCPKCNQQIRMSELFEHEDYQLPKI